MAAYTQSTVRPLKSTLLSVRRSLPLFLAIVVCLVFWQVWLTWRLMEQDRSLAAQRSRERLEQIAGLCLAQLASVLAEWDLSLREMDALPPSAALKTGFPLNATLILLASPSLTASYPSRPLLFVPEPPAPGPLPVGFDTADRAEFRELAELMLVLHSSSTPTLLQEGAWHLPLLQPGEADGSDVEYWRRVSVGRCARVSYLTHDGVRDPGKDIALHDQLLAAGHMSPFEHIARVMTRGELEISPRSGNFEGFVQYRKLLPNESDYSATLSGDLLGTP